MAYRLNKGIRSSIAKNIVQHAFEEKEAELAKNKKEFAQKVYEAYYTEAERKKMKALPSGWLPTVNALSVPVMVGYGHVEWNFPKSVRALTRDARYGSLSLTDTKEPRLNWLNSRNAEAEDLFKEMKEIQLREEKIKEDRGSRNIQVLATLNEFATVEKLLDYWPEIEKFVPNNMREAAKVKNLPSTLELNKALNLPPQEKQKQQKAKEATE